MTAQLLIHSLSSHVYSQRTACATVAPVSAGTDGRGTLVKSGWGPSTEERSWRGEEEEEEDEEELKAQAALEQPHQQMILTWMKFAVL